MSDWEPTDWNALAENAKEAAGISIAKGEVAVHERDIKESLRIGEYWNKIGTLCLLGKEVQRIADALESIRNEGIVMHTVNRPSGHKGRE
jgi:hypothetical protein